MRLVSFPAPRALFSSTLAIAATFASLGSGVVAADQPTTARNTPLPVLASRPPLLESYPASGRRHLVIVDPVLDENAPGGPVLTGQIRNECPNGNVRVGTNRPPIGIYENGELLGSIPVADFQPGSTTPFTVKLTRRPISQTLNVGLRPATGVGIGTGALSPFAIRRAPGTPYPMLRPTPAPSGTLNLTPHVEILVLPPCG